MFLKLLVLEVNALGSWDESRVLRQQEAFVSSSSGNLVGIQVCGRDGNQDDTCG